MVEIWREVNSEERRVRSVSGLRSRRTHSDRTCMDACKAVGTTVQTFSHYCADPNCTVLAPLFSYHISLPSNYSEFVTKAAQHSLARLRSMKMV